MPTRSSTRKSGFAAVLAIILLSVLVTLGVSFAMLTNGSMRQAMNLRDVQAAQNQAESGLEYLNYVLRNSPLPPGTSSDELVEVTALKLSEKLPNVTFGEGWIAIPQVALGEGTFAATMELDESGKLVLCVTGTNGAVERTVGLTYTLTTGGGGGGGGGGPGTPGSSSYFFGYGIATRSKISITGNARIQGTTPALAQQASILSTTYSDDEALVLTGNSNLAGDVFLSNPDAYATLTGNVSIGGHNMRDGEIEEAIHTGIGDVEFPEVDPTVFESFATNIVNSSTSTSGNKTFTNIRIAANTNPNFSGNITINGVVFIEQPNNVRFTGNLNMTGVIVTEDAGENVYDSNTVRFTGNSTFRGVDSLPDTVPFHTLREKTGSFILAPGFGLEFTGNFGAINGTMAADQFKFTGNAGGVIKGMIINYSDSEFKLTGNSSITIDRTKDLDRAAGTDTPEIPAPPPGVAFPVVPQPEVLKADPGTYTEYN